MANVLFTRTSDPNSKPVTDGQLIFDTSGNGKMYLDNGTDRLEMGGALTVDATLSKTSTNPVQNKAVAGVMLDTLSDIGNVTSKGFLTDALAVKELNTNVNELNNSLVANSNHFYFDYKNGKYGYNTDSSRGADTFFPFNKVFSKLSQKYKTSTVTVDLGFQPDFCSVYFVDTTYNHGSAYTNGVITAKNGVLDIKSITDNILTFTVRSDYLTLLISIVATNL